MSKIDIPKGLKSFSKEFEKLTYRNDTTDVFCDFIDLMVAGFKWAGDKELGDRLKKKYKDDYQQLCICVGEMLKVYEAELSDGGWYDGLGSFYEVITSSHKSSRLGQFFTPSPICDIMASINASGYELKTIEGKTVGKIVGDPCCGSGRMLLAFNKIAPNNYHYATDIDQICVKMTAINMCIHAITGQVVCADALWYGDSWRFGYQINRTLKFGLPSIENITQNECFQSGVEANRIEKKKAEIETERENIFKNEISIDSVKSVNAVQLSLF